MKNNHKNMICKRIWFKKREFERLSEAVEHNEKELVFEILAEMKLRGDLEQ